jgi:hypothetical protein
MLRMLRDLSMNGKSINDFKSSPFVLSLACPEPVEGSKDSERFSATC